MTTPIFQRSSERSFLGIIVKESERLTRLIDDILDLAKMESGKLEWQMKMIEPRELIEEAIAATNRHGTPTGQCPAQPSIGKRTAGDLCRPRQVDPGAGKLDFECD